MSKTSSTAKLPGGRERKPRAIIDRQIRWKCSLQNTIFDVLKARAGWQEVPQSENEPWDFFWCDREWLKENFSTVYLHEFSRICHFRNHYELTRKNLMVKNLKRLRKQIEREQGRPEADKIDFYPTTFELPSEYHIFVEEFKKNPGTIWIMKPVAKSQGRGIFLFRRLKDITDWKKGEYNAVPDPTKEMPETYVVQRYVENPYLIGGKKFDVRVYVLVTSFVVILTVKDVHLTNVAVQKTAPDYDPEKGCKWSTQQLRQYLTARHGVDKANWSFSQMDKIFVNTLQSVQKVIINDRHCFELYGYDILLDANLKPWLIEINASPSLTASNREDWELKFGLLSDVLYVLDLEGRLTGKEKRIGGFDLIWDEGPVMPDDGAVDTANTSEYSYNSFLGCYNDRRTQLKQMFKTAQAAKAATT